MTCEAERRNKQALYILENEWGCGRLNIPEMQRILRAGVCDCKPEPTDPTKTANNELSNQ